MVDFTKVIAKGKGDIGMKKTKKLMAALLCVLLMMTLLPVTALAEDIGMAGDLQPDPLNGQVYLGA